MPQARCPQCQTVVSFEPGHSPTCPTCGFSGQRNPGGSTALVHNPGVQVVVQQQQQMMGKPKPPGMVVAAAVLIYVQSGLNILFGLLLMLGGGIFAAGLGELGGAIAAFLTIIGIFMILYSAAYIWMGVELLKGKRWAQILVVVLTSLGLLFSLMSLLVGNFIAIISIGIGIFTLVALLNRPGQDYFAGRYTV